MKIVVGTDFNPLANAALRAAASIPGAELIVVYADTFEPPAEFTATQLREIAAAVEESKMLSRRELDACVASNVPQNVKWRTMVVEGLPAPSLAAVAGKEGADLIAVGTHGRGALQRLMTGSVAAALLRESPVPVLAVRSTGGVRTIRVTGRTPLAQQIAAALGAELVSEGPADATLSSAA